MTIENLENINSAMPTLLEWSQEALSLAEAGRWEESTEMLKQFNAILRRLV